MANVEYGPAIRDAIASSDLQKMKRMEQQAKKLIKNQGDLYGALIDLQEAIKKLESKAQK